MTGGGRNKYNYVVMGHQKTIYDLQAEVCKTLASPKRLEIIHLLKNGEKTVTDLVELLGVPKANVSQHLAVMRHRGVLASRRDGVNVYYRLSNPKVVKACMLMREVLTEQMIEKTSFLKQVKKG